MTSVNNRFKGTAPARSPRDYPLDGAVPVGQSRATPAVLNLKGTKDGGLPRVPVTGTPP